jgi:hypothetical protein
VISRMRYLWRSCAKVVWCYSVASCQLSIAVAVAVAVTNYKWHQLCGASSSDAPILVPDLVMRLSWCQLYGVLSWCQFCGVDQLSTLARV